MIFKKGDIVKTVKELNVNDMKRHKSFLKEGIVPFISKGRLDISFPTIIVPSFNRRPIYVNEGIGEITDITILKGKNERGKAFNKRTYRVFFLFAVNVEDKYVSYYKSWFWESELRKATEDEMKRYNELKEVLEAKEVAEKL
jgi:hypothetical protein